MLLCFILLLCCVLLYSRTFINDTPVAFDPERAMAELVLHTHYLPRHWRGRAHSAEVQQAVNSMFTLKVRASVSGMYGVPPFFCGHCAPQKNCIHVLRVAVCLLDFEVVVGHSCMHAWSEPLAACTSWAVCRCCCLRRSSPVLC